MKKAKCMLLVSLAILLAGCSLSEGQAEGEMDREGDKTMGPNNANHYDNILIYDNASPFCSADGNAFWYIDLYDLMSRLTCEAKFINEIMMENQMQFEALSGDGTRALFSTLDYHTIYRIYDFKTNQFVYEIEDRHYDTSPGMCFHIKFLPNLNGYIRIIDNDIYLYNVNNGSGIKMGSIKKFKFYNCVFSPDESRIAYIKEDGKGKYICIYDIKNMEVIKEIHIGEDDIYLKQWHQSGKLLYNYGLHGYIMDLEDGTVKDLGKYVFYPLLSPDGRYLAYSHPVVVIFSSKFDSLFEIDENYTEDEVGLFVLDIEKDEVIKLDTSRTHEQYPLQWFGFDKAESESLRYTVYTDIRASSYLWDGNTDYEPELAFDGDKDTAWVENEDWPNHGEKDGIGEWIKIMRYKIQEDSWVAFEVEQEIPGVDIINGYAKSKAIYKANNRVKTIKVEFSDGTSVTRELEDDNLDYQRIEFDRPVTSRYLKFVIMDVYKDSKYSDTCIS